MVDILTVVNHYRTANIVMTLAAVTALWFRFASNLQNAAIVAVLGLLSVPQSLSALWCRVQANAGQRA